MHADEAGVNRLSERIIGCAFRVLNTLGAGFLEKVYENALAHELRKNGLAVAQQQGISVRYDGIVVGEYAVDLLVEETIIIENEGDQGA
jgi:GxxExxY protein